MSIRREIVESPMPQGVNESIVYTLTTTPWGSSPTSVTVTVYNTTNGAFTDVTTTVMPTNSPSVSGNVITLSPLRSLTVNNEYRVQIRFTSSGNIFEPYAKVNAEL